MAEETKDTNVADSENEENTTETTENSESEKDSPNIEELMARIDAAEARAANAEKQSKAKDNALDLKNKEISTLKGKQRETLSDKEKLEEERAEFEAEKAEMQKERNRVSAKGQLAPLNYTDKEMTDDELELFVRPSMDETVSLCKFFVDTITREKQKSAKEERDKIDKENPKLSGGGGTKSQPDAKSLNEALTNYYQKE